MAQRELWDRYDVNSQGEDGEDDEDDDGDSDDDGDGDFSVRIKLFHHYYL